VDLFSKETEILYSTTADLIGIDFCLFSENSAVCTA